MQVNEIFYTIQGEGVNVGVPAVFLRLSGCHLRCVWCDTKYTWDFKSGKKMSTDEVATKIKKFPAKHLVITGGEPLIQQSQIIELLKKLPDYYIEVETSGTLQSFISDKINHFNCSPKLSNSKNRAISLVKLPAEKTYYKFVVEKEDDLDEIMSFIEKHEIDKSRVFFMPEGITKREINKKSLWLVEVCKKVNVRFSPRLHVNIWGKKRKV